MSKSVADILRDGGDTFEKKTQDYGQSWRSVGHIIREMAHDEPIVLDSPEEIIAFGLFTRRLDKLSREFYGTFFAEDMNFEGPVDSAEDESVYAAMSASNLRDMADEAETEEKDVFEAVESFDLKERYPETGYDRDGPLLGIGTPPEPDYDFEERVLAWADDFTDHGVLLTEDVHDEFSREEESEMAHSVLDGSEDWDYDTYAGAYFRT
ncbi:hypothetical protein M1M38_gp055 [Halorubrum tailed virus 27]|uniref:Uncharacterized protein n=1 Tax=Halorubrum tailed virus 27 TaxID=2878008 RepID=A0AAE9BY53_9CAUD|nr:hypothetical protein M1M38_gp055 [Halorubrum tailed virus 27]UBF22748.1 hypothetical protein HRTV-27_gp55 [Halorubrum tailed virus 27]